MVPFHKIEFFRGAQDFFGPLNGTSDSKGNFGAKKVKGPLKSRDFVQRDHFESLKWPHLVIFKGFIS
jgi:hypothetical protein